MQSSSLASLLATMRASEAEIERRVMALDPTMENTNAQPPKGILKDFSTAFGIPEQSIIGKRRNRGAMEPRKALCFVLRMMGMKYVEIGRFVDLHHASVVSHCMSFRYDLRSFSGRAHDAAILMISKYVLNESV